ncbi:MAG: PA2169 family four-helix-bundle protein [Balneolales bacterium]|nr:PA2169 family four-helix-bundle protein [Balneolales bacterium]
MHNDKTIAAINKLVEINNDRIEGYENAFKNTDETDLREIFSSFAQNSKKCQQELVSEINKLGGKATDGTTVSGKFFRGWMDVKSALTGKDRKAILESCEYGEEQADETYQKVLGDEPEHMNPQQFSMIKEQHNMLKADQSKIRTMLKPK